MAFLMITFHCKKTKKPLLHIILMSNYPKLQISSRFSHFALILEDILSEMELSLSKVLSFGLFFCRCSIAIIDILMSFLLRQFGLILPHLDLPQCGDHLLVKLLEVSISGNKLGPNTNYWTIATKKQLFN